MHYNQNTREYRPPPAPSIYFFDLAVKEGVKDDKCTNCADQMQKQVDNQLFGLQSYLNTAIRTAERIQTRAEVKWKLVENSDIRYRLLRKNAWIEIRWKKLYRIIDFTGKGKSIERIGIDIDPYSIEVQQYSDEDNQFLIPVSEEDGDILDIIADEKRSITIERNHYCIACEIPTIDKLSSEGVANHVIQKRIDITNGIRLLIQPAPSDAGLNSMRINEKKIGFDIELHGEEYPPDLTFHSENNTVKLSRQHDDSFLLLDGEITGKELNYNDLRYNVVELKNFKKERGVEISLEEPDINNDDFDSAIDPRYYFFDENVDEVWLDKKGKQKRKIKHRNEESFHIWLDSRPSDNDKFIYIPINTTNIRNQLLSTYLLQHFPLEHHRNLIRLFENPKISWPDFNRKKINHIDEWCFLKDETKDGTRAEREFVEIAMGTPDYAFLEGPPGSGKTTAIAELVYQLAKKGNKVLLLSNTHYAIDNVLERIVENPMAMGEVSPLRISRNMDKVDDRIANFHFENLKNNMIEAPEMTSELAERIIMNSTNLVCGTTTGVGSYPPMDIYHLHWFPLNFYDWRGNKDERIYDIMPLQPIFDYLIIDESSKSTFQEFLYPALFAKRWILVGDVRQLSPFTEDKDMIANVESLPNADPEFQKAMNILFQLISYRYDKMEPNEQWAIVDSQKTLKYIQEQLIARIEEGKKIENGPPLPEMVVCLDEISLSEHAPNDSRIVHITIDDLKKNGRNASLLLVANWILIPKHLFEEVCEFLQPNVMVCQNNDVYCSYSRRHEAWLKCNKKATKLKIRGMQNNIQSYREIEEYIQEYFKKKTWASEWVWRVRRKYELRFTEGSREKMDRQIDLLTPRNNDKLNEQIENIKAIAFPSILESLQIGIPSIKSYKDSFLSKGLNNCGQIWNQRHTLLEYQHRMDKELSAIPRLFFYKNDEFFKAALKDANTIEERMMNSGFNFLTENNLPVLGWVNVEWTGDKRKNRAEADAITEYLEKIMEWAKDNPPKHKDKLCWDVAILTFFLSQEKLISEKMQDWSGDKRSKTRFKKGNIQIIVGTIDRFQGREADIVLLSLRNTNTLGFMDSMNRMNVGLTRAKYHMVIFGRREYYRRYAKIDAWKSLAEKAKTIQSLGGP